MEGIFWNIAFWIIALNRVTGEKLCFTEMHFGVATAAYQIEGAWNVSGKGENIWDRYTHQHPERVFDHKNGDTAADSYHNFKEDVRLLKELGVDFYRFSMSWSRILPSGMINEINPDGIRYYNDLINELQRNKIAPLVTMYHWDLPQNLQDLGGWTNPVIVDYFVDYARVLFENFGDKVHAWITFNEPFSFCHGGYGGNEAPGSRASGLEDYMCGHNVLRAHAKVYNMFRYEFMFRHDSLVGITLDFPWFEPSSTTQENKEAAETARQFSFGWFAHPIFSREGDYPPIMRKRIDEISKRQNFSRSRLPTFTYEEASSLINSADFLGLNHYTTYLVTQGSGKISSKPSFDDDAGVVISQKPDWPRSNSSWLKVVPWGFRKALNWIKNNYNDPGVIVTENGVSQEAGLDDKKRMNYIDAYLRSLHAAIEQDNCTVFGYTYWSLIDNFEWMRGFSERFGLYQVDYESPQKTRNARLSAEYYANVSRTKCIPDIWETGL